jgi:hypothetical protein
LSVPFAIALDAETVTGGATGSDQDPGPLSTVVVIFGSLGTADFIFSFICRLAAF